MPKNTFEHDDVQNNKPDNMAHKEANEADSGTERFLDENGQATNETVEAELTLTKKEYRQYLMDNYFSCVYDKDKIKIVPEKDEPDIVKIGNVELEVKPYTYHRLKRILKKYCGNPDKGGYRLEKIYEYKWGRYPGQELHYDIVDNETDEVIRGYVTLRELRIFFSGIAGTGFPLEDQYDQIFMMRWLSWQEHGFPDFPY